MKQAREANLKITSDARKQPVFGQWSDPGEDHSLMNVVWVHETPRWGHKVFRFLSCAADSGCREWKSLVL